jgi:hypothetical protein
MPGELADRMLSEELPKQFAWACRLVHGSHNDSPSW